MTESAAYLLAQTGIRMQITRLSRNPAITKEARQEIENAMNDLLDDLENRRLEAVERETGFVSLVVKSKSMKGRGK